MQIREIRWLSDGGEEDQGRGQIPLGPAITILDGGPAAFSGLDFWGLQADLVLDPGTLPQAQAKIRSSLWLFLLSQEDRTFSYASDQEAPGRQAFFRHASLGGEAQLLAGAIDYAFLADGRRSARDKADHLHQVFSDLEDRGRLILQGNRGGDSLGELEAQVRAGQADIQEQEERALLPHRLLAAIEAGEKEIQAMRAEDGDLAHQQQEEKYLAIKTEYERLLRLREELEETEAREGAYGSRITGMGHNITVHELTELARMRNESRQLEEAMARTGQALEDSRRERMKAEQDRALLGRRLQELERERLEALSGPSSQTVIQERSPLPVREEASFPTSRHLLFLALALVLAAGLFLAYFYTPLAYVLAGLALLFGLVLALRGPGQVKAPPDPAPAPEIRKVPVATFLEEVASELDGVMSRIKALDEDEARYTIEHESLGRQYRRLENELLRQIRPYAGPSETGEVDDILLTLSRQRDSSAYFQETVSDLLRQIAELKHGRSEDEMLKEYDKACAMLYGIPDTSGLSGQYLTRQLTHDPDRARRIHDERVALAGRLDQRIQEVKQLKERLKEARESTVTLASLGQRQAVMEQSLEERALDYRQNRLALAWMDTLLRGLDQIDIQAWMNLTLAYLGRLTGRRPGAAPLSSLPPLTQAKIRPPRMGGAKRAETAATGDPSLFGAVPRILTYLAARLALSALPDRTAWSQVPLILLEPDLPDISTRKAYLLDSLEVWALETGRQVLYFSLDDKLISLARERRMTIGVAD